MDTVYKIFAGVVSPNDVWQIENHVAEYFNGFTSFTGVGYWKGARESCSVIEILGVGEDRANVLRIASWIKTTFKQESVAITESPVTVYTVGRSL